MKITLIPASEEHIEFLVRLRTEVMKPHFQAQALRWDASVQRERVLNKFEHAQIVCYERDFIGLWKVVRRRTEIELLQVQILPHFQRKGITSYLIQKLQDEARLANKPIYLSVLNMNPAMFLYQRCGFIVGSQNEQASRMIWQPEWPPSTSVC